MAAPFKACSLPAWVPTGMDAWLCWQGRVDFIDIAPRRFGMHTSL